MARDFGQIKSSYWTHPAIQSLPVEARTLGAYLLTCQHTTSLGCFRLPVAYIADDLGYSTETISKLFRYLNETTETGFAWWDPKTQWVLLPQFLDHNPAKNPKHGIYIAKLFDEVPTKFKYYNKLVSCLLSHSNKLPEPFIDRIDTISKQYRYRESESESESESKNIMSGKTTPDALSKKTPKQKFTDADLKTAKEMYRQLLAINPSHKQPNEKIWASQIRLMREGDKRTDAEIRSLFGYAMSHDFWHRNILSPNKLRVQWDRLVIERNAGGKNGAGKKTQSAVEKVRNANRAAGQESRAKADAIPGSATRIS